MSPCNRPRHGVSQWWRATRAPALAVVILWSLTTWYIARDRQQQLEFAADASLMQVQLLAEHTAALFRQIELGLRSYPASAIVDQLSRSPTICTTLRRTVLDLPGVDNAVLLSPEGIVSCSATGRIDPGFPIEELLTHHTEYMLGFSMIPAGQNRPYLTLAVSIDDEDGRLLGVLAATVPQDHFAERYRDYGAVNAELIALFDANQTVLARWPAGESASPIHREPLLRGVSESDLVTGGLRALDTDLSIAAVFQLPGFAYRLVIASPQRVLLERWWASAIVSAASAIVLGLTVGAVGTWAFFVRERRRRTEEELAASYAREQDAKINRLEGLRALSSGLAHDINNRMMVVLGNAQLLELDTVVDSRALQCIQDAANQTVELSERMLFAAGHAMLTSSTFDLSEYILGQEECLRGAIESDATLTIDLDSAPHLITGDVRLIGIVVRSLVENAAEAINGVGGKIVVAIRRASAADAPPGHWSDDLAPGSYIAITVTDNGDGMSGPHRDRVFDPFYSARFLGRGLGLSAAAGITRQHGGAVLIDSTPGSGTMVSLYLPSAGTGGST